MLNTILWPLIWFLIRMVLNVSREFVTTAITAVDEAESTINENGELLSGPEKRDYVLNELEKTYDDMDWDGKARKVANVVLELAVNYIKGFLKSETTAE